ncbi:hypothetical protein [Vibrio coralliilyticus]|uniref:hypothetical protein n=1 Tax=Vibrio coralliilyticus TaxID=190893 RepID=UPI000681F09C|nr:hypothetical protein [Vibrio coralliilyticus]NOI60845.1 hypothetical protein [Vibrio coralliilyticus]PAT65628.1 hypothetical protein CKA27_23770 [Vibrio coralliilyticus]
MGQGRYNEQFVSYFIEAEVTIYNKNKRQIGAGYKPLHDEEVALPKAHDQTAKQRLVKQRQDRKQELAYTQEDEQRWAANRARVLASRMVDQQMRLVSSRGVPIANSPYFIVSPDKTYQGVSDSEGFLPRVSTTHPEELEVYIGVLALERWHD